MNADLKRVRDSSIDGGPSSSKRRAVAAAGGASSPISPVDAEEDGVEDWVRVVEAKRKEAIYRQMLDYRRSFEREQGRANALERQRRALEDSLRSVETCWAQLVTSVRERAGQPNDFQEAELLNFTTDPSTSQSEQDSALQLRLSSTLRLVSVFADLAAGKGRSDLGTDLQQRLAQLQAESSTLRANSAQLQSQIDHLCQSRDTYLRDLQRAEKHLDKQKMEFDKERAEWRTQREASGATNKPVANGSGHSTPNARTSEPEPSPATPAAASNATNAPPSAETTERIAVLEQLAGSRLQELETLREQHVAANKELDRLKLQAHHPPESQLRESPFFQVYLTQLSAQAARADTLQARFESAEQKLDQLRDANLEFRDAVVAEARTEVETLRQQLGKKDTDLARLRGQRDEMNAELLERRTRESEKSRFAEEVEALCTARQERISFLTSEVRRLKGKLASHDGAEGFLAFLKGDGGIDGDYVKSLEEQLVAAKDKTGALTAQIESLASGDAAAAEMAVRTELAEAKRSLSKYQRVLGSADVADDVKQLAERLQEAITSKSQLELKLSESEASTDALYAEVEGLSKQWETLEQTLRTKVFELKDGELRMARLSTEKAKADNKFFQAMRAKEAIEAECKTAQRSVDKQLKLLERARDVERALTAQIAQQEKGTTSLKNAGLELQTQLATATSEKRQLELRLQQSQAALAEAQQLASTRVQEAAADKEALTKLQEEADATKRSLDKLRQKHESLMSASAAGNVSAQELQIREEREKLLKLLRCSCCDLNFKQQIITKCMHTFCKPCLDSRIASRQRKCPACGLAFAKEDCQTLYWQ